MITRVVVDDFDIELYREGAEFIRFSAGSATIGSTLDLKLRDGFSITTGQGDELIATKGRYLRDEGLLKVVGPYTFTSPVGRTSGRNALFQVTDDGEILKLDETSG
jgi:hypothetical protein